MSFIDMINDSDFSNEINKEDNRDKLIVANFTSFLLSPMNNETEKRLEELPLKYYRTIFLRVYLERCRYVAATLNSDHLPIFTLYFNGEKLDSMSGDNEFELEVRIKYYYAKFTNAEVLTSITNLRPFICSASYSCVHEAGTATEWSLPISDSHLGWYMKTSGSNPRLLITITFSRVVNVRLLKIEASTFSEPMGAVILFVNPPHTIKFDTDIVNIAATTEVQLTRNQLRGACVELFHPTFLSVSTLQIVINHSTIRVNPTVIYHVNLYGSQPTSPN